LGSAANIAGGTIGGNGGSGLWVWVNSTAQITQGASIQNNSRHGVELNADSKLWVFDPITVGGNAWFGVYCNDTKSSAGNLAFVTFSPSNGAGAANCSGY